MKTLAIAVASWGPNRLDIFGLGTDNAIYHKAWDGGPHWQPIGHWERLGGGFVSPPAVVSWGANRLDIFGLGTDNAMYHKYWDGGPHWQPIGKWENLGGVFYSPPAVVSSGPNRLDVFGLGTYNSMYHKAWNGSAWQPVADWDALGGNFNSPPAVASSAAGQFDIFCVGPDSQMYHVAWNGNSPLPLIRDWDALGGIFDSPPAVVSWGANRLDIFCVNTDNQLFHKALNGSAWLPSLTGWDDLGTNFDSPPAVASWGPNQLDIFCLGTDDEVLHLAWNGSSPLPSITDWGHLGGRFVSPPAVASWGANRLDIFGLGTDNAMYHKAWDGGPHWQPSQTGWDGLGGVFNIPTPEPAGVGSSYNYILSNNCNSLIDVSVTIYVTQDIVVASDSGGSAAGFAFQLNAYSTNSQNTIGWQQYGIIFDWGNLYTLMINNWPPNITNNDDIIIDIIQDLVPSPTSSKIPAGYLLTISLANDENTGNVIGATYTVVDNKGNLLVATPVTLPGLFWNEVTITSADLAPIVAFQLDIVGPINAEAAVLSSGAGTITYSAASALTASSQLPACAIGPPTGENANTFYGPLPIGSSSNTFTQSFNVSDDSAPAPPPSLPQLNANAVANETGYDVSWSGTGFPAGHTVWLYLVGLTGQTAPLQISWSTADTNGNISGDYTYTCIEPALSLNVILQAQIGSTIFASTTGFDINCTWI